MNNTANNFPIGTFSIEQATQPAVSQAFPQTDYFNPATASQLMSKWPLYMPKQFPSFTIIYHKIKQKQFRFLFCFVSCSQRC